MFISFSGIVKRRWSDFDKGAKIRIEVVFKANHIQVNSTINPITSSSSDPSEFFMKFWAEYEQNPFSGRNVIVQSIAPNVM